MSQAPLFESVESVIGPAEPEATSCSVLQGDALNVLGLLKDESFQCCVTSPPYWGLRDYGISGQIGAEPTLGEYIRHLVKVFAEVRRVLTPTGTLWLNIGDSYTSGGRTWRHADKKNPARGMDYRAPTPDGLKPKDLIGVPWRLAFALQEDGWYLRSDIVWQKPNCQPESVKDRPTRSHEYIFLLSKNERYLFNHDAIAESSLEGRKKNKRTVWSINTEPNPDTHFATFPRKLVEPCILAGSSTGDRILDPFLGSGTSGLVALQLCRDFTGIELNPEYIGIARRRLAPYLGN
ncbi:site-specific DNA-methyltransferase [soil metagenome]